MPSQIELKDPGIFERASAEADWENLRKYLPLYPSIAGGFLIYVARRHFKRGAQFQIKRSRDTRRLWPTQIVLEDEMKDGFEVWNTEYKKRAARLELA